MVLQRTLYAESDLDGQEPGGFVVINVDAPAPNAFQILENDGGGYFRTLTEAREACRRSREESHSDEIYVYALVGIGEALDLRPGAFELT